MGCMDGKTGLVVGIANDRSYAWFIAESIIREGDFPGGDLPGGDLPGAIALFRVFACGSAAETAILCVLRGVMCCAAQVFRSLGDHDADAAGVQPDGFRPELLRIGYVQRWIAQPDVVRWRNIWHDHFCMGLSRPIAVLGLSEYHRQ